MKLRSLMLLTLLLASSLITAISIKPVGADETITILADGSIDPPTAPITSLDNITYTLTGNIVNESLVVQRDNIVIDGSGFTLQGSGFGSGTGIDLTSRSNVTVKNIQITNHDYGVWLSSSSGNSVSGNNISASKYEGIELDYSSNNSLSGNNITANKDNYDGIVLFQSSNNTVSGNSIANNDYGVDFYSSSGNSVSGNNISASKYEGIELDYSSNNSLSGNNITANNYDGIALWSSSTNSVSGNNITNNGDGIDLSSSSSNNSISGNSIAANNYYGIWISSSSDNSISGNNITANNYDGIRLIYSSRNTSISGNTITDNYDGIELCHSTSNSSISGNTFINDGLSVSDSYPNSVENNTVNGKPLVYLQDKTNYTVGDAGVAILVRCDNIRVENLSISRVGAGVQLSETNNSIISCNSLTNDGSGMWLIYSYNNSIIRNNITANYYDGIYASSSSSNTIIGNNIGNNAWDGVDLDGITWNSSCSNNNMSGNNIARNGQTGIQLSNSSGNSLSRNNITANGIDGIWLNFSSNNSVYHNNFINNPVQVNNTDFSVNSWDEGYPSGGNFWSDYNGTDLYSGPYQNITGSDGIGDTPYAIDARNVDYYPLITPYETVPPEILLLSPQNLTYYNNSVPLNFTVYDYSPVSWMGYSLDGEANVTISGNATLTLADGLHQLVVYANDTFGNMGSSTATSFTVDTTLHDLAVTNATITSDAVAQGEPVSVNVTIENLGDSTETFNVTVYANVTAAATLRNVTLPAHNSTTVSLTWNTFSFALGNYTVGAYAWPVPGETNTADNTFTGGTVQVTPRNPTPIASGGTRKYVC